MMIVEFSGLAPSAIPSMVCLTTISPLDYVITNLIIPDVTFTAVQVLLKRVEDNPFSEWTALLTQLIRAAIDCHGTHSYVLGASIHILIGSSAFTAEQMSKLSGMLEGAEILAAGMPHSRASPRASPSCGSARNSSYTPDSGRSTTEPFQPSRKGNVHVVRNGLPYGNIAKEFGVEPHLVEALAHRLSKLS